MSTIEGIYMMYNTMNYPGAYGNYTNYNYGSVDPYSACVFLTSLLAMKHCKVCSKSSHFECEDMVYMNTGLIASMYPTPQTQPVYPAASPYYQPMVGTGSGGYVPTTTTIVPTYTYQTTYPMGASGQAYNVPIYDPNNSEDDLE